MSEKEEPLTTGFDPNDRELCPDGACIGVIGADGRCAECGKSTGNKAPKVSRPSAADAPAPTAALSQDADGHDAGTDSEPRPVEGDAFDPARRELCPDGACIGVIGADGRCAECGEASPNGAREVEASPSHPQSAPDKGANDQDASDQDVSDQGTSDSDAASDEQKEAGEPAEIEQRRLCPDGACIGVIGSNGRCKECGTRAE